MLFLRQYSIHWIHSVMTNAVHDCQSCEYLCKVTLEQPQVGAKHGMSVASLA